MKNSKKINIFAHKGYSYSFPENTKIAFKSTKDNNFDGVEFDIHQTKDNVLVVIHDEDIKRTSNGKGLIKDSTYLELLKYNFNYNFKVKEDQKLLTLKEALEICNGLKYINIEVKNDIFKYKNIEKNLITLLDSLKLKSKVIISSFNVDTLLKVKSITSKYSLAWVCYKKEEILKDYKKLENVCEYINPWFSLLLDPEMVEFFTKVNKPLILWSFENSNTKNKWVKGSKEFYKKLGKYKNIFGIISNNIFA